MCLDSHDFPCQQLQHNQHLTQNAINITESGAEYYYTSFHTFHSNAIRTGFSGSN